jgi:hypothetical protein
MNYYPEPDAQYRFLILMFIIAITKQFRSVNPLHERKLCSRSRKSEQYFVLVYRVYPASIHNISVWIFKV